MLNPSVSGSSNGRYPGLNSISLLSSFSGNVRASLASCHSRKPSSFSDHFILKVSSGSGTRSETENSLAANAVMVRKQAMAAAIRIILLVSLICFFVLIFVEIIELNIFGLQKNTKRNITQRSDSEEINATTLNLHSNDENGEQRLSLNDENYYIKV